MKRQHLRRTITLWLTVLAGSVAAAALQPPAPSLAQDAPLSSIDWLSDSLAEEAALRPERRTPPVAEGGAAVAVARERRRPGTLQVNTPRCAVPGGYLAEQQRAAITQLRHEMPKLVADVALYWASIPSDSSA